MFFLVWKQYISTLRGQLPKYVACESCQIEYVYIVNRIANGRGTSPFFLNNVGAQRRAEASARSTLDRVLAKACEPIPCPACGHLQRDMIPQQRRRRRRWANKVAVYLLLGASLLFFPIAASWEMNRGLTYQSPLVFTMCALAVTAVLGGLCLPIWRLLSNMRFDPNSISVEDRLRVGRSLSMSRAEFERQLASNLAP